MKKIIYFLVSFLLLINNISCTGYKPIFSSTDLQFAIADHSIVGDKKLGKQIYSKLYMSSNKDSPETKSISILINVSKEKKATSKDSTGKILEYKINLTTNLNVKNYLTDVQILNEVFTSSISYKVQDNYSDTINLENKSVDNLLDKIYQEFLIQLTENLKNK